jgi:DNA-binding transcriptional LysR family regulator
MGTVDLRQLSFLVTVAEEGGVRAAARRLDIAQPPVSQALRALEAEFGVTLLERSARGVRVTEDGAELVRRARDIIKRVEDARRMMRQAAERTTRQLRVGLVAGVISAGELTAPILDGFRRAHPHIDLHLEDISWCDQESPLRLGQVDVAILRDLPPRDDLTIIPIASEPRSLLVGATHPLASRTSVTVEEILDQPMLALGCGEDWAAFWHLDEARGGPNVRSGTLPARTVAEMQLHLATEPVVITCAGAMARLAPNPLVRALELRGASPTQIVVAHRAGDHRARVGAFAEIARQIAAARIELLAEGTVPGSATPPP